MKQMRLLIALLMLFGSSLTSFAQSPEITSELKTFSVNFDYGLSTTYKSKLLESNDVGSSTRYGLGINAGGRKQLGVSYVVDTSVVAFETVTGSITSTWTDWIIEYRFWLISLGVVFGNNYFKATKDSADLFESYGVGGYGGYFSLKIPLPANALLHFDYTTCAAGTVTEVDKKTLAIGSRADMDLGAQVNLTRKMFDFVFGYRTRAYSMTFEETAYAESVVSTYLGIRMGSEF